MKPGKRSQRGYILLPVVLAITLVAVIAFLLNREGTIAVDMVAAEAQTDQVRYVAEAGLRHALWKAQHGSCNITDIPSTAFGDHSYQATITPTAASVPTTLYSAPVDQDTWLSELAPTVNYGNDAELKANNQAGDNKRALYRFDLSAIPAGWRVLSATAKFFVTQNDPAAPVNVYRITDDWAEGSATWSSTADRYDSRLLAAIPARQNSNVWVTVDLAGLVQAWLDGAVPNYGVMLVATSNNQQSEYTSKEWLTAGERPTLEIIATNAPGTVKVAIDAEGLLANGNSRHLQRDDVAVYGGDQTSLLQPGASSEDTYLWDGVNQNKNFGIASTLSVNNASAERVSLLRFDLSSLPASTIITSARLGLYLEGGNGLSNGVLDVHRATQAWVEGTQSGSTTNGGATYMKYALGSPWNSPGGDYQPVAEDSVTIPALTPGWYEWDVSSAISEWVAGSAANDGFLLRASGGTVDKILFTSSDGAVPANHPRLTITYRCPCGASCPGYSGMFGYYRDEFTSRTCIAATDYSGSDGTLDWTPWAWNEISDDSASCSGDIAIVEDIGNVPPGDFQLRVKKDSRGISRQADLSTFAAGALLSFDYRRAGLAIPADMVKISVSTDGASWTEIGQVAGPGTDAAYQHACYDISAYRTAATQIRFMTQGLGGASIYIDNVQIDDLAACLSTTLIVTADSYLKEDAVTQAFGADQKIWLNAKALKSKRGILQFDTSSFTPGTALDKAMLRLYITDNKLTSAGTVKVYQVLEPWIEAEATWNERLAAVPWSTAGGVYQLPQVAAGSVATGLKNAWIAFDITPLAQTWVDFPAQNDGALLTIDQSKDLGFASRENGNFSNPPQLVITLPP